VDTRVAFIEVTIEGNTRYAFFTISLKYSKRFAYYRKFESGIYALLYLGESALLHPIFQVW
jgi:hypothetical protein